MLIVHVIRPRDVALAKFVIIDETPTSYVSGSVSEVNEQISVVALAVTIAVITVVVITVVNIVVTVAVLRSRRSHSSRLLLTI